MTTTTTSYRKTRAGQWVVFGPASLVHEGQVTVTKRDGSTKTETIESVGKTFTADGIEARYGYIAKRATSIPTPPSKDGCSYCGDGTGSWTPAGRAMLHTLEECPRCGNAFDF